MTALANLPDHLKSLEKKDWAKLFELQDAIASTKEFGKLGESNVLQEGSLAFPHFSSAKIVDEFQEIAYELGLVINFDWSNWKEGKEILSNRTLNYRDLDVVILCKLITVIIRGDRFVDGTLKGAFENGIVQKIVSALEIKIES